MRTRTGLILLGAMGLGLLGASVDAQEPDQWVTYTNASEVNCLAFQGPDTGYVVWAGTNDGGLLRLDPNVGDFKKFTTSEGMLNNYVSAVEVDGQGIKWVGTATGACRLDDKGTGKQEDDVWTCYDSVATGYQYGGYPIKGLEMANPTIIWIGTDGDGLYRLDHKGTADYHDDEWVHFVSATPAGGLPADKITCLDIDTNGHVVVGTANNGFAWLDDKGTPEKNDDTWIHWNHALSPLLPVDQIYGLTREKGTNTQFWVYFGFNGNGMARLDFKGTPDRGDDEWLVYTAANGLLSDSVFDVGVSAANDKWISYAEWQKGATRLNEGADPATTTDDTIVHFQYAPASPVTALDYLEGKCVGIKGDDRWFGHFHGLSQYDEGDETWAHYAAPVELVSNNVRQMAIDLNGIKWFVYDTPGKGISRLDDKGTLDKTDDLWTHYNTGNADLLGNDANFVAVDTNNVKWVGIQDLGVSRLDGKGSANPGDADCMDYFEDGPAGAGKLAANHVEWIAAAGDGVFVLHGSAASGMTWIDDRNTKDANDDEYAFLDKDHGGMTDNRPVVMLVDGYDKWVTFDGAGWGVAYFNDGGTPATYTNHQWNPYPVLSGVPTIDNKVTRLCKDTRTVLWAGFGPFLEGVARWDHRGTGAAGDDHYLRFTQEDHPMLQFEVSCVAATNGLKWIGLKWLGVLALYDQMNDLKGEYGERWRYYTAKDGIAGNKINCLLGDSANAVWVCTSQGVSRSVEETSATGVGRTHWEPYQ